jgi:hypothetical protein
VELLGVWTATLGYPFRYAYALRAHETAHLGCLDARSDRRAI